MSIFTSQLAVPSRLRAIYLFLSQTKKPMPREELSRYFMPPSLLMEKSRALTTNETPSPEMFLESLLEGIKMGLFQEKEEMISLHPNLPSKDCRENIHSLIFSVENSQNHDMAEMIAWFLTLDPLKPPKGWGEIQYMNGRPDKLSPVRMNQVIHWARFFGFASVLAIDEDEFYVPDPTPFLRCYLDKIIPQSKNLFVLAEIFENQARLCPVLEGGYFREKTAERLDERHLSPASAQAWLRLKDDHLIELEHLSDAPAFVFPDSVQNLRFTHARRISQSGGKKTMSMKGHVCWYPEYLPDVMNIVATSIKDHMFLAIHSPMRFYRTLSGNRMTESQQNIITEQEFLKEFINPSATFTFVPVIGKSGTGKSHLIRWLKAKMPPNPMQKVVWVPKVNTNLRDVIELIIQGLEGNPFDEYRDRLSRAAQSISRPEMARVMFLQNLSLAIGPAAHPEITDQSSARGYVCHNLHFLLNDPHFSKNYWLKEEGVIDRLRVHMLGDNKGVEDRETRRGFSREDLPLRMMEISRASQDAQDFYGCLCGDPDLQKECVDWLNQNLNSAITQTLHFSGSDLAQLMKDVRRTLHQKGMELVLLIEDFAVLQGIDYALLDALLAEQEVMSTDSLCPIRTALACTKGYFDSLPDTARTRATFLIYMDISTGEGQALSYQDIEGFMSRYLNAARLPEDILWEWHKAEVQDAETTAAVPNACEDCFHRDSCHAGFGASNRFGLYPFNQKAVQRMYDRVKDEYFNSRIVIKEILQPVLNEHRSLQQGQFPSPQLHRQFGVPRLTPAITREIESKDPAYADRRKVLLDLWSDGNSVVNLDPIIHEAFSLSKLSNTQTFQTLTPEHRREDEEKQIDQWPPAELEKELRALDQWHNEVELPDRIRQNLRELLFTAVKEYISWDEEGLAPSFFVGSTALFRQRDVYFLYQKSQIGDTQNHITLQVPPSPDDVTDAAYALQGLLMARHLGNWYFPDGSGGKHYRAYRQLLDSCASEVLHQIHCPLPDSLRPYSPVDITVELLALGTRLHGLPAKTTPQPLDMLDALFAPLPAINADRDREWKKLCEDFSKKAKDLREILLAYVACTKGGSVHAFIDPTGILPILQSMAKRWEIITVIPETLPRHFKVLPELRDRFNVLDSALQAEKKRYGEWFQTVRDHWSAEAEKKEIYGSVEQAVNQAINQGLFQSRNGRDAVLSSISQFKDVSYKPTMEGIERIVNSDDRVSLLYHIGQGYLREMKIISNFIENADDFLNATEGWVQRDIEQLGSAGDLERVKNEISQSLDSINDILDTLGGDPANESD